MDPLTILTLIDAAVKLGGSLGPAILTLIEGHGDTPDVQRQQAGLARERLAASSASIDARRDEIRKRQAEAGESTL